MNVMHDDRDAYICIVLVIVLYHEAEVDAATATKYLPLDVFPLYF